MIRGLVFCCLVAVALAVDEDTCIYKGKLHKKGDRFMDGCNFCFCGGNDNVGCSKMLCKPGHNGNIETLEGNKDTCIYKGKLHKKGDRFMDGCNFCFCGGNDNVGCSKMLCKPGHNGNIETLEGKEDTCDYKGKMYKKGDRFMDDCNHCFCGGNDMVGCTKMMCRHHHEEEIVTLEGNKDTCIYKGKLHKKGDRFMDGCNFCFCGGNDNVGCSKMLCKPGHNGNIETLEGNKDTCIYKGKLHKKGDRFMDGCNFCFCGGNDNVGCSKMLCKPGHNGNIETLEGKEDTCDYKGKMYKKGDRFMDDCNHCFCGGNDMVGCTKMLCIPHDDERLQTFDGTMEDSETCTFKGVTYKKGENFKVDCNICFCGGNNIIGCTAMLCPIEKHAVAYDTMTCKHKGKTYNLEDHFMDDCNQCICAINGNVACTQMACIHPKKRTNYVSMTCTQKGRTFDLGEYFMNDCSKCFSTQYADSETCSQNGKVYNKGDHFPSVDGCNMCFCGGNGMIGCTKKACLPKGCFQNGKFLQVGEHYKNECNQCICTKHGGVCTKKACLSHKSRN